MIMTKQRRIMIWGILKSSLWVQIYQKISSWLRSVPILNLEQELSVIKKMTVYQKIKLIMALINIHLLSILMLQWLRKRRSFWKGLERLVTISIVLAEQQPRLVKRPKHQTFSAFVILRNNSIILSVRFISVDFSTN